MKSFSKNFKPYLPIGKNEINIKSTIIILNKNLYLILNLKIITKKNINKTNKIFVKFKNGDKIFDK
tara:strand:+ start:479 stop:676 length:198 start_codon:yes stop_codon:yes gene_type:complete